MRQVKDFHSYVQHCEKKINSINDGNKINPYFHDRKKSKEGKFTIHAKRKEKQAL